MKPGSFEPGAPQTVQFARVRPRIEQRPFAPFQNVTTRGAGAKNRGIRKRMEPGNGAASWSQQGLEGPPDSVRNHGVAAGGGVDLIGLV